MRRATSDDHRAIVALVESAYRGTSSRAGWTTEADLIDGRRTDLAMVREIAADPDGVFLVIDASAGDLPTVGPPRVVASAGRSPVDERGAGALLASCHVLRRRGVAHIGMVAVSPTAQGRGVGRALLAAAEAFAADVLDRDATEIAVIVQRTELIAWYRRLGYAPTGERRPFPYGDERYGVPSRPDLELVVLVKGR
ncbi:MAG: GNAT family N-acetyltransferase [Solirubrobacteraceae bacterium]|nr:GNAT family N-acetyltransferase [Solirubrobacteraceae bacterium]